MRAMAAQEADCACADCQAYTEKIALLEDQIKRLEFSPNPDVNVGAERPTRLSPRSKPIAQAARPAAEEPRNTVAPVIYGSTSKTKNARASASNARPSTERSSEFATRNVPYESRPASRGPAGQARRPLTPSIAERSRSCGGERKISGAAKTSGRPSMEGRTVLKRTSSASGASANNRIVSVGKAAPARSATTGLARPTAIQRAQSHQLNDVVCQVTISFDGKAVSSADIGLQLKQDGLFLYLLDEVTIPPFRLRLAALKEQITPGNCVEVLTNFSVGVVAKVGAREALIFESHKSHVEKPPVSSVGDSMYFSHSCWLSSGSASLVGGVRVFLDMVAREDRIDTYDLVMSRFSLKFWYADGEEGVHFNRNALKEFLTSLGILD